MPESISKRLVRYQRYLLSGGWDEYELMAEYEAERIACLLKQYGIEFDDFIKGFPEFARQLHGGRSNTTHDGHDYTVDGAVARLKLLRHHLLEGREL
jgi:hypothetical protein